DAHPDRPTPAGSRRASSRAGLAGAGGGGLPHPRDAGRPHSGTPGPVRTLQRRSRHERANDVPRRMHMSTTLTPPVTVAAARTVNAVKVYGQGDTAVRALDGVTVEFPAGRFTAIMGPSGSGKSTLMHCVAGLDQLTSGEVYLRDVELGSLSDQRLTRLRRSRL